MMFSGGWGAAAGGGAEARTLHNVSRAALPGPPPTGRISWSVPPGAGKENAVVVTIKDATGQEVFHTFNLSVE
jgi:hypothetical protein